LLGGVRARNKGGVLGKVLTKCGLETRRIVEKRMGRRGKCWVRCRD
jgi:hypothetical protein